MLRILGFFVLTVITSAAQAQLAGITNADAASGLRQALTDGAASAVAKLGVADGFSRQPASTHSAAAGTGAH
jgi:hypothetical protein